MKSFVDSGRPKLSLGFVHLSRDTLGPAWAVINDIVGDGYPFLSEAYLGESVCSARCSFLLISLGQSVSMRRYFYS